MPSVESSLLHVAIIAFPFSSHPVSLFALAKPLATAAPDVIFSFISSDESVNSLSRTTTLIPNLRLCSFPSDGIPEDPATIDHLQMVDMFQRAMPGNLREGIEAAVKEVGGKKVTCIVSDALLWKATDLAEEMDVPLVALRTGAPSLLLLDFYTDELRRSLGIEEGQAIHSRAEEPLNFIPGLSAMSVGDLPRGMINGNLNDTYAILTRRSAHALLNASAVVLNIFEGLYPEIDAYFTSKFKNYLPIGPIKLLSPPPIEKEGQECLSWLDSQSLATVAYVSFGTIMLPPLSILVAIAHGLEASGTPFLWSLKEKAREGLPEGFLERTRGKGLLVNYAPQVQVLGHKAVGTFVSHCGWNSVLESMTSGVPMVCRPMVGDQKGNARMVTRAWGMGITLEGETVTTNDVEKALNMVLREEEGNQMRMRAAEIKEQAIRAVGPSGTSIQNFKRLLEIVCA